MGIANTTVRIALIFVFPLLGLFSLHCFARDLSKRSSAACCTLLPIKLLSTDPFRALLLLLDCGIRPSTASEAEFLQDFINRTNNARNQNANSRPTSQSGRSSSANEDDSPDDDDDEGNDSSHGGHHTSSGLPHLSLRSGQNGGRRSPVYFSMTDDKTPTVGGFNAAQAQALNNTGVPSYTSLRRRAADGIVTSNVTYPSRSGGAGTGPNAFSAQGGGGTLRPGQSVRQLRGFPDIEEAIGQGQLDPHPNRA